ncbi:hypothetical protein JL722_13371 [Aureococcus anophagefferens]|nr:hypothetical protein JL722_13371 [Aureococcus anophagefferens]
MATTTSMLPLLNVSSGVKAAMAEGSEVRREAQRLGGGRAPSSAALDKKEVESANHSRETLAFVRRVVDLPPFRSWGDDKIVKLRAGQG